MLLITCRRL